MRAEYFASFCAVAVFLFVLELIRRRKMTLKYSLSWLAIAVLVVFLALNKTALFHLSSAAGFTLPSNFIFFVILMFFVFLSLLLTVYVNEQNSRVERLNQTVALLDAEIKELKELLAKK